MDSNNAEIDPADAADPEHSGILGRRRMLTIMGGAGLAGVAAVAAACSSGDAATATTMAGGSSSTSTTSPGASTSSSAVDGEACTEIPDETAGPFPGDGSNGKQVLTVDGVVRRDITTSFGGSTGSVSGVPLTVNFDVLDVAKGCEPMAGAAVYAWHCDADGQYSLYSNGVTDQNWLRGVQIADENGRVTFTTIVPGCYEGRWPHIHFEVYPDEASITNARNGLKTSQLAFPKSMLDEVYATADYQASVRPFSRISLASDMVFSDDQAVHQMATITGDVTNGYTATLSAGV
ncbi:MAG TPA: intradiol ring-cleavage dioxygenase [Microthrixaceae bacterium]|jgi:protocatechuate 3,4-dioxygenase beta subunit|nr:intradiol ring-cleavage dioxygenase [Microthrixaceae bacterium]